MRAAIFGACAALGLAACVATPTTYGPAAQGAGYGYSETAIEADRYRISFAGNAGTSRTTAENYAMLRAAEITLGRGASWFRVVSRNVEAQYAGGGLSVGTSIGGYSGGRTSVGGGVGVSSGGGNRERYTAMLEIIVGSGPAPEGYDVYDANQVRLNTLGVPQGAR